MLLENKNTAFSM